MENEDAICAIITSLFHRSTFAREIFGLDVPAYTKAVDQLYNDRCEEKNIEVIKRAYQFLSRSYRNEYFYKNTLFNKLVLGVHSLKTTTALTELPIMSSRADFIMINGKATVFEIKTELDNLERLDKQVRSYYQAFDHVAIVTDISNLNKIIHCPSLPQSTGIYLLQKNSRLKIIRKPLRYQKDLNKKAMFRILRKSEYENILLSVYHELPQVTPVNYYRECCKWFEDISMDSIYPMFLHALKNRSKVKNQQLFTEIPYEIRSLIYFMNLRDNDYKKLIDFLYSPARRN